MFVDIYTLKTEALGKIYQMENPDLASAKSVHVYDKDNKLENATALGIGDKNILLASEIKNEKGYTDAWLCMVNEAGVLQWEKFFGEGLDDRVKSVHRKQNGDWVMGGFTNRIVDSLKGESWLFRLENDGKRGWSRSLGKTVTNAVESDSEGNIYACGNDKMTDSTYQHYVLKLNAEGKKRWTRQYVTVQKAFDMAFDSQENLVIACNQWIYSLDKEGYLLWEHFLDTTHTARKLVVNQQNEVILAGIKEKQNVFITKLDNSGKVLFEEELELSVEDRKIHDFSLSSTGKLIVTGKFSDGSNLLILNATADMESKKSFKCSEDSYIRLKTNANGDLLMLHSQENLILTNWGKL
jgi:hypothetical protein